MLPPLSDRKDGGKHKQHRQHRYRNDSNPGNIIIRFGVGIFTHDFCVVDQLDDKNQHKRQHHALTIAESTIRFTNGAPGIRTTAAARPIISV